jgi:hypothetical protein
VSLARQFDLDLTLLFVPRRASIVTGNMGIRDQALTGYELGDLYDRLRGQDVVAAWEAALSPTHSYDVILLSIYDNTSTPPLEYSGGWGLLPESLQKELLLRVKGGTGLLAIRRGPPGGPNPETSVLASILPLVGGQGSDYSGHCYPRNDRTVRGLPWIYRTSPGGSIAAFLPTSGPIYSYSVRTGATVLVEIDYAGQRKPLLARSQYGAGRVLDLVWGPYVIPPDASRQRPAHTEGMDTLRYDFAFLGRLVHDAARREPAIAVHDVLLGGTKVQVELEQVLSAVNAFDMDWVARDRFSTILDNGHQSFSSFPANRVIQFPVPQGTWTVDVVLQPASGEPGWGAGAQTLDFAVATDPDLDAPDFRALSREGKVRVTPTGPATATQYAVDVVDGRGRVVAQERIIPGASALMSAGLVETPRAEVRVHALDVMQHLVGQAVKTYRVRGRTDFKRWPIYFWDTDVLLPRSLLARHLDAYTSLGISAYLPLAEPNPNNPSEIRQRDIVIAADQLGVPYGVEAAGWLATINGGGTSAPSPGQPCTFALTDGEAFATGMTRANAVGKACADLNVLYYRIGGDEPHPVPTDVSFDPCTMTRFRAWLSERYGHANSRLQREWGSTATLATATPSTYANALAAFNSDPTYAPWVDHRRFVMDLFSRAPAAAREGLRHGDPEALIGTSGDRQTSVALSLNWWLRGRALDVVGRYRTSTALELRALRTLSTPWTAYDDPDPIIRHRVWTTLGLGENGLALFAESSLVNPDLTLPEVGRDLTAALLPVRRGVGSLFAASRPADDGIFVLSSPDSSAVLAIHGYESLGSWQGGTPPSQVDLGTDAREGVHELLGSMGVGWSAISPAEVETGALERKRAKVLILPMCAALSDEGCEAIRRWVASGGRLIADLLPGTFTAHGRLRGAGITTAGTVLSPTNPLSPVLGITPGARPSLNTSAAVGTWQQVAVGGGALFPIRCLDTALVATPSATSGGTAVGGAPLWFQSSYQQGQAAYLGCSVFADYLRMGRDRRLPVEAAFAALLQNLGVTPRAQIYDATGQRVGLCQLRVRSAGSTELAVLLRDYAVLYDPIVPEIDGELRFSSFAHTYDLDNGVYLGYGDRLKLRLGAYTFRAFARLPYRVQSLGVQVVGNARLGDPIAVQASLNLAAGQPGRHHFRLDVAANGRPLRYLAREVSADCGAVTFTVPTALNDPTGPWTIQVTDVNTGIQGKTQVNTTTPAQPVHEPEPLLVDSVDD